jgi:NADH-quinone oxidoreductase subunit L
VPLVILAVLSIFTGWWNVTGGFGSFMGHGVEQEVHGFAQGFFGVLTHRIPLISLAVALFGILIAYMMYCTKWISAEVVGRIFKPFYLLFSHKYWLDELYERIIVVKVLINGICAALNVFDSRGIDGTVNGLARGTASVSSSLRKVQTGQLQVYAMAIVLGMIAIVLCIYIFG